MFPTYHRNLIKPKTTKVSILINVFVVFFSLNFNSFLFAPTFAEESIITETTIENTLSDADTLVEEKTDESVEEGSDEIAEEATESLPEESVEDTVSDTVDQTLTGEIIEDVLSGSSDFVNEVPIIPEIGPNLNEILSGSLDSPLSGNLQEIVEEIIEEQSQNLTGTINSGGNEVTIQIDQNYFDSAFEKDIYNHKVFDLQNILISLGFFTGVLNGIYDEATIMSVYQYQLSKGIMKESDDSTLRGFFGPTTREYFNQEYVTYKQNLLNGISNLFVGGGISQNIITEKDKYASLLKKVKEYFIQNRYSLENIFGTGVFVGNEDIDFSMLSGQILLPLIFQSTNTLGGNIAEVEFEPGTILKDGSGNVFTGSLSSPEFLDESVADELIGQDIISVLDVGGNDEKIVLEDSAGEKVLSKVKIPVPGQSEGNLLDINYSHDGETWTYMLSQKVFLENGEPYVEFETSHFTMFSISLPVGTFFVNNNAFSTSTTGVTLNINVSGATHMRFANTGVSLTGAAWVTYATGYSWNVLTGDGLKTVFAQFSGSYGTQSIADTILLDTSDIDTSMQVILKGRMGTTDLYDDSSYGNHDFAGYGGLTNTGMGGDTVYSFNGTSQYANKTNLGITAYPFTVSAWVNTSRLNATQSIIHIGNSTSATIYYGIEISSTGYPAIVARNTTLRAGTSQEKLYTGRRYHVVGVFTSGTSMTLYVDGNQRATQTTLTLFSGNTNPQIRIGRYVGAGTSYFSGYMDDIRIHNKALSVYEIRNLYDARIKNDNPIQYLNVGEFNINSGESNTYKTGVSLISSVTGMTHMRFANDTGALTSAPWVTYNGTYARYLSGSTGNNIVYAQYSGVGGVRDAQDNIFLDSVSDANLKILLDGTMNGTNVSDITSNANNFSGVGTPTSVILSGEKTFLFNGTTQYLQRTGINITAYPFTFSAWVQTKTIVANDAIIMMGNSGVTNTFYGIQLVNGAPSIVAQNTTAVTTNSTRIVKTGQRYHIVGVFNSGTNRTLYVNGELYANSAATVANYSGTNSQIRVGRYVASSANYFDGYIDDARVYNKSLSAAEIKTLYTDRSSRVMGPKAIISYDITGSTSGPVVATLTGFTEGGIPVAQNGIQIVNNNGSGLYTFTGNGNFTFMFKDSDGNIGSTIASVDWITPTAGGSLSLSGPASFSFGSTMVSSSLQSREKLFTGTNDYFDMIDEVGADAGYYTTLAFSDLQYNSNTILKNNIYVKTDGGITLRAGTANANVVTAITGVYLAASSPLTFIKRDAASNGGKTGTYGAQVAIKVDIPAFQQPGNYTGTITYTLY